MLLRHGVEGGAELGPSEADLRVAPPKIGGLLRHGVEGGARLAVRRACLRVASCKTGGLGAGDDWEFFFGVGVVDVVRKR